jgi:hypothetical protein
MRLAFGIGALFATVNAAMSILGHQALAMLMSAGWFQTYIYANCVACFHMRCVALL